VNDCVDVQDHGIQLHPCPVIGKHD
jgi:hypothetical protein